MARRIAAGALLAAVLACAAAAGAQDPAPLAPATTLDATIRGGERTPGSFLTLGAGPGEPRRVREDGIGTAQAGREARRVSLAYFTQLTDFQLVDGESPARVEFSDPFADRGTPTASAWRPQEELGAHVADAAVRQTNRHASSPVTQGDGARAALGYAITTGDSADNAQANEVEGVVTLLEGGRVDPGSGSADVASYPPACQALVAAGRLDPAEAPRYTGVQDYDDSTPLTPGARGDGDFYDPDEPFGRFAAFPAFPGLMDRAQQPFAAAGLSVPSYVVFGNHDGLAQGNQATSRPIEDIATGCVKPLSPDEGQPDPTQLDLGPVIGGGARNVLVPPDERRRFLDKAQYKRAHATGRQADAHGFAFVDPAELAASNGAAGYYSFAPRPGIRMIALDTVSEGGVTGPSSEGNIDDPQFRWLERELRAAQERNELVIPFGHHGLTSMQSPPVPDEAAPPCSGVPDRHEHDTNPGCDVDPRVSTPIRGAADLEALFHRFPNVVAFVAGHSHVNDVRPYPRAGGGGFWLVRTAAEIDWPQQSRLLEIMDNRDGTLSIFGTVLDHAAPVAVPMSGTPAAGLGTDDLGAIGRVLAFNDPQGGGGTGEGTATDRNVELLVGDPRRAAAAAPAATASATTQPAAATSPRASAADPEDGGADEDAGAGARPAGERADPATGRLPFTGGPIALAVLGGLALLGAGAALRRRVR